MPEQRTQLFREIDLAAAPEAAPAPGVRPKHFKGTAPRTGDEPLTFDWWGAYFNAAGEPMAGGDFTVQWYGVAFNPIQTIQSGVPVTVGANIATSKALGARLRPWCTASAGTVPDKTVRVYIDAAGNSNAENGTYTIEVTGDPENPYEHESVDLKVNAVMPILAGLFAAHPTLTVEAGGNYIDFTGPADFELTLTSPSDSLLQETLVQAASIRIFTTL